MCPGPTETASDSKSGSRLLITLITDLDMVFAKSYQFFRNKN